MMTHWSGYERFLKPIHLKGQVVTLTIVKTTEEPTHPQQGKTVTSPVLWFRELPFGLILSPTNRQTLIALYGDVVADCLGKPINVQAVDVKVAGNSKQPIRILKQRPNAPKIEPATGEIVQPSLIASEPEPTESADLPPKKTDGPDYCRLHLCSMQPTSAQVYFHVTPAGLCNGTATIDADTPDSCKLHIVKMSEMAASGIPFHRLKDADGHTLAYCDGVTIKPNGKK